MKPSFLSKLGAILAIVFVVSGCAKDSGGLEISGAGLTTPAISPLLTGMSANSLNAYRRWFIDPSAYSNPMTPDADGVIPGVSDVTGKPSSAVVVLDPRCGLTYAYDKMANSGWDAGKDGIKIATVDQSAKSGFYNAATQQVLFLLNGYAMGSASKPCADRERGYIPLRLDLVSKRWNIDGYASPGATIEVRLSNALTSAELKNEHEINDSATSIISPSRLTRFTLTEENYSRVYDFANVSQSGGPRRLFWFRASDIAPSYAHLASGSTCVPAIAFWGKDAGCPGSSNSLDFANNTDPNNTAFADSTWRQSGADSVGDLSDDDGAGILGIGDADPQWKRVIEAAKVLAQTATTSGGSPEPVECNGASSKSGTKRANASCVIQDQLRQTYQGLALQDGEPSGVLGDWTSLPPDVFPVVADNGKTGYDKTKDAIKSVPGVQGLIGLVGDANNPMGIPLHEASVTISPSLVVATVQGDKAQAAFYESHSFIFNAGTSTFNIMSFSTDDPTKRAFDVANPDASSSDAGLPYTPGPLTRVQISVSNALDMNNTAVYSSSYIPALALWEGTPTYVSSDFNPLTQFGRAVSKAINDAVYGIYSATVGSFTASLSRSATGNLLAVPVLEQFTVLYYANGQPVYKPSSLVLDLPSYRQLNQKSGDLSPIEEDQLFCTKAYSQANFNRLLGDNPNQLGKCVDQNGFYTLWESIRSFSILLMVLLIARYFYGLMSFETGQIRPIGFMSRVFIAMALTLGMNVIIGVLARVVAETILLTNLIGTNLAGGAPYSHLWLFAAYLRAPSQDLSVFLLMVLAPFTIIGLLVLMIVNWLRIGMATLIVCLSPFWVFSLLTDRQMKVFTSGLTWMMRLYLIPLTSLFLLMVMYLMAKSLHLESMHAGDPVAAIVGFVFMIILAVVPILLSKYVATAPVGAIKSAIKRTNEAADNSSVNAYLEAGAPFGAGALAARNAESYDALPSGREVEDDRHSLAAGEEPVVDYGDDEYRQIGAGRDSDMTFVQEESAYEHEETEAPRDEVIASIDDRLDHEADESDDEDDVFLDDVEPRPALGPGDEGSLALIEADDPEFDAPRSPSRLRRALAATGGLMAEPFIADYEDTRDELRGSLAHQGAVFRKAGLLHSLTGTAFVARHSASELAAAEEAVAASQRSDYWISRDPAAKAQAALIAPRIAALEAQNAAGTLSRVEREELDALYVQEQEIAAGAKRSPDEMRRLAEHQRVIDDAAAAGGAGTNWGRAMTAYTDSFAADLAAYRDGQRRGFGHNTAVVRLAGATSAQAAMAKAAVVARHDDFAARAAAKELARSAWKTDAERLSLARASAAAATSARTAMVHDVAMEIARSRALTPLDRIAEHSSSPAELERAIVEQVAAIEREMAASRASFDATIAASAPEVARITGGVAPKAWLKTQRATLASTEADRARAQADIDAITARLAGSFALPERARTEMEAERAAAVAREASTAALIREVNAAIEAATPVLTTHEKAAAGRAKVEATYAPALTEIRALQAQVADPGTQAAAMADLSRRRAEAAVSARAQSAQLEAEVERLVRSAGAARDAGDAAAEAAAIAERDQLLAGLDARIAQTLAAAIETGATRQAEVGARQRAAAESFERNRTLRDAPPLFDAAHGGRGVRDRAAASRTEAHQARVYAERRAKASAAITSMEAELVHLREAAGRGDAHALDAVAETEGRIARAQAIVESITIKTEAVAMQAEIAREQRAAAQSTLDAQMTERLEELKLRRDRLASASELTAKLERDVAAGKADRAAVDRARARAEREARELRQIEQDLSGIAADKSRLERGLD